MAEVYRVIIQPEFVETMESAFNYIAADSIERARDWATSLMEAVYSLSEFPIRCPLAREQEEFVDETRQLLYGKRPGVYRTLFTINDGMVNVHHLRHGARQMKIVLDDERD